MSASWFQVSGVKVWLAKIDQVSGSWKTRGKNTIQDCDWPELLHRWWVLIGCCRCVAFTWKWWIDGFRADPHL